MKKPAAVLLFLFLFQPLAWADGPFVKLGRGFANIVLGPVEYIVQWHTFAQKYDPVTSFFGGLFKGTATMLVREVVGVYEVVTFPVPLPWNYEPVYLPSTPIGVFKEKYTGKTPDVSFKPVELKQA